MSMKSVVIFSALILLNACANPPANCCPDVTGSIITEPRTVGDYVVNCKIYERAFEMCHCK